MVDNFTSLAEIEDESKFSIYPNPAEFQAIVSFDNPMNFNRQEVQMFNILGEQVFVAPLKKGTTKYELKVEDFPKGIYFVNVVANGTRMTSKKMIVK